MEINTAEMECCVKELNDALGRVKAATGKASASSGRLQESVFGVRADAISFAEDAANQLAIYKGKSSYK